MSYNTQEQVPSLLQGPAQDSVNVMQIAFFPPVSVSPSGHTVPVGEVESQPKPCH